MSTPKKVKYAPAVAEDEALVNAVTTKLRKVLNLKNSVLEEVQEELTCLKNKLLDTVKTDMTRQLFVKHVLKKCEVKTIREMFGECGAVIDVEMVVDFNSRSFLVYFNEKESREKPFSFENMPLAVNTAAAGNSVARPIYVPTDGVQITCM
ncbi:hypothetical protein DAPPUDRAFT_328724 [Daphnia pulex]|uniref:RRM domain-containing protein n=1 Tax=Daphnia pulex TaxID=6669 RepID=E9HEK8_DAPPU|nr:hypothetical protein DAPPUDRAFT_328724 [Daphnia pulex]|eukprot:EFX69771.1 hypothetical protein DAPPUDRAFT_328724 [Daphnia pulex]